MTGNHAAELLRAVRPPDADAPDAELLARFAARRDEPAFRELVRRHGPLVLGVCRRAAGHAQDAEDAFQAVFLILARKAAAVRRPELLGNYLYGVAVRVARRARRAAARRRKREVQVPAVPDPPTPAPEAWADLAPVLDEELSALPEWYRAAVLLCDLQGLSRAEAAARLGVPEGTLSSRLNAGRKRLADRLARRGITLSAAGLAVVMSASGTAAVSDRLVEVVLSAVDGMVPGAVAELAQEGVWPMRAKLAGFVAAAGSVAAVGWAVLAGPGDPPAPPTSGKGPAAAAKSAEKPAAVLARPRLLAAADLPIHQIQAVAWFPDGKRLAVHHHRHRQNAHPNAPLANEVVLVTPDGPAVVGKIGPLPDAATFAGFAPPAGVPVTELREYNFISGRHELAFWSVKADAPDGAPPAFGPRGPGDVGPGWEARTVRLDADETFRYRFAPDGKTFRTVARGLTAPGAGSWLEVRVVDAATGETKQTLPRVDVKWKAFDLSPDGRRLAVVTTGYEVEVWDADAGRRTSRARFGGRDSWANDDIHLAFSPDGRRLAATRRGEFAVVLDAATGETVLAEPDADGTTFGGWEAAFSADGRLVAWIGEQRVSRRGNVHVHGPLIRIWDVDRRVLLKSWTGSARFAFAPDRPVLAVLERASDSAARVGFWDFAAVLGERK